MTSKFATTCLWGKNNNLRLNKIPLFFTVRHIPEQAKVAPVTGS
jgi:hypothetical protein